MFQPNNNFDTNSHPGNLVTMLENVQDPIIYQKYNEGTLALKEGNSFMINGEELIIVKILMQSLNPCIICKY